MGFFQSSAHRLRLQCNVRQRVFDFTDFNTDRNIRAKHLLKLSDTSSRVLCIGRMDLFSQVELNLKVRYLPLGPHE